MFTRWHHIEFAVNRTGASTLFNNLFFFSRHARYRLYLQQSMFIKLFQINEWWRFCCSVFLLEWKSIPTTEIFILQTFNSIFHRKKCFSFVQQTKINDYRCTLHMQTACQTHVQLKIFGCFLSQFLFMQRMNSWTFNRKEKMKKSNMQYAIMANSSDQKHNTLDLSGNKDIMRSKKTEKMISDERFISYSRKKNPNEWDIILLKVPSYCHLRKMNWNNSYNTE